MTRPNDLCDAAISHMIRKGLDIAKRKKFLAGFMKTNEAEQLEYINSWVMVRDVANFPLRFEKKEANQDEDKGAKKGIGGKTVEGVVIDEIVINEVDINTGEVTNEDKGTERGVSVDDGADEEPKSWTPSK